MQFNFAITHTIIVFLLRRHLSRLGLLLSFRNNLEHNNMASTPPAPSDFDNLNDAAMFQIRSSVEFYFKSIHENMPAFYLPKEIVDSMGAERLARVAHNYA